MGFQSSPQMHRELYRWSEHRSMLRQLRGIRFTTHCRLHLPRSNWKTSKILNGLRFHVKMVTFHSVICFCYFFGAMFFEKKYHQCQGEHPSDWRGYNDFLAPDYLGYRSTMFLERFLYPTLSVSQLLANNMFKRTGTAQGCRFPLIAVFSGCQTLEITHPRTHACRDG